MYEPQLNPDTFLDDSEFSAEQIRDMINNGLDIEVAKLFPNFDDDEVVSQKSEFRISNFENERDASRSICKNAPQGPLEFQLRAYPENEKCFFEQKLTRTLLEVNFH